MPSNTNHSYNNNLLDDTINNEFMRICKCMLPYMDSSIQKKMAIGIKFFEFITVMNLFSSETVPPQVSLTRDDNWEKNLLLDIRSQLTPEKAYLVDAALKLGEFRNILKIKNSINTLPSSQTNSTFSDMNASSSSDTNPFPASEPNKSSSSEIIDKFSPFLDDSQKQMLKMFSTFMK